MNELALLVLAASGAFAISRWLGIPVIPLLIVLGFGLARLPMEVDEKALRTTLDLGLAFLVFSAGIELNPSRYQGKIRSVLWVGTTQFVAAGAIGFLAASAIGFSGISAVFLGVALSTSSTLVVVRQLQRRLGAFGTYGRLVVGVLLVQDVAMIFLVVLLSDIASGIGTVTLGLLSTAGMAALAFLIQKVVAPRVLLRFKNLDDEQLLLVILTVLFSFAGLGVLLKVPPIAGAFFAGFALSGFPVNGVVRSLISSLTTFFIAVFFTALGALIDIPTPAILGKALILAALVICVTPPLVTLVAEWKGGLPTRSALTAGLLLAQTSEFALILGLYGLHEATADPSVFSIIALVAVITMTLTPFLATDRMARRLLPLHPDRLKSTLSTEDCTWKDHVLILGFGTGGMWVLKPLRAAGHEVVVVDQDPFVIDMLSNSDIACIRGDGSDEAMLQRVGAPRAKLILASMAEPGDAVNVLKCVGDAAPVVVRVFEEAHARLVENAGGIAILNSEASADAFMEWFDTLEAESEPAQG